MCNIQNLPTSVEYANHRRIVWIYDSNGSKLRKLVYGSIGVLSSYTDYIGGIEYSNGAIDFIPTDEGRARPRDNGSYGYEYVLKDHLGNVRMTVSRDTGDGLSPMILQEDSYYPFGMKIAGLSYVEGPENKYTYNGKELVDEFGLNWYHYGARYYDPQLGRWHSIDPADEFHSPYTYCGNNPIMFVDPDGMNTDPVENGELRTAYGYEAIIPWWSLFGEEIRGLKSHTGLDIAGPIDAPILAFVSGTIIETGDHPQYGKYIKLQPETSLFTTDTNPKEVVSIMYCHLKSIDVNKGDFVKEAATIGKLGMTGNAISPFEREAHLHIEFRTKTGILPAGVKYKVNPLPLMSETFQNRANQLLQKYPKK